MIRLLLIIFILNLFCPGVLQASNVNVSKVIVNCGHSNACRELTQNFKSLKRSYVNTQHLQTILKLYVVNEGIKNFNYSYDSKEILKINLIPKEVVTNIKVQIVGENLGYPSILPINEGEFMDMSKIERTKNLLRDIYINKGFPSVKIDFEFEANIEKGIELKFIIRTGKPITVNKIKIISDSTYLKEILHRRLSVFKGRPFDIQEIKNTVEDIRVLYLSYGYYLAQMNLKYKIKKDRKVGLFIDLKSGDIHKFDVRVHNDVDSEIAFKNVLSEAVVTYKRILTIKIISQLLKEKLRKNGYLFPVFSIVKSEYQNSLNDHVHLYRIKIKKGERSFVNELDFRGNNILSKNKLLKIYYENSFEQASRNIFDEEYYKNYQELLRQEYIKLGYVNVFIDKPQIKILPKTKNTNIIFRIREGLPSKVTHLKISGVSTDIKKYLFKKMKIKNQKSFNPIAFKEDLEMINSELKKQGFYYARITNQTETNIVRYNKDNSQVYINIEINLDKRLYINNLIIVGNRKTRTKFIKREIFLKKGEVITPDIVNNSQTNLLSLGLFSSVNIKPVKNISNKADVLISVKEKDFGLVVVAPGVRTDLGPKLSTSITYNNLDGMNKRIKFKGQVNQRFNLHSLDEQRRQKSSSLMEYAVLTKYSENNIFNSVFDFSSTLSKSRKRFYSFDADIQKISLTTSWDTTKWFSSSLTYQLQTISQYDSTLSREHGHFQIGSITPGFIFDFRNSRMNPTQGAYFNLTCELANPTFLSQSNDELEVNYYKLLSRNRFYAKIPNGVLAMSVAAGYQKNLATAKKSDGAGGTTTAGYIPNIKVFRLSGMDIVRGFEDNEINRLVTNQDISKARVDQRAYMANIKIEPRFFLSDATMIGLFYDAGRVFVDTYDLSQLRSSAGVSFKYLTPVGTLNFDYGIKLLRKRDSDGNLETPGRLHVSIGFF